MISFEHVQIDKLRLTSGPPNSRPLCPNVCGTTKLRLQRTDSSEPCCKVRVSQCMARMLELILRCLKRSYNTERSLLTFLVRPLEWRDGFALILIQSVPNDRPIPYIHAAVWSFLPGQGVLHPILVIAVWEVFSRVCTTRLLPIGCCCSCLRTAK